MHLYIIIDIILGIGSFTTSEMKENDWKGTMSDVAASPNDPVFINHHTMIDCLFEQWLQKYPNKAYYVGPLEHEEIFAGHSLKDCIVPSFHSSRNV